MSRKRIPGFLSLKTLCLILKSPRVGEAKKRLAIDIGPRQATTIYRVLVSNTKAEIPSGWDVAVYFTPADAEELSSNWQKLRCNRPA
jgi:hypothetical protein